MNIGHIHFPILALVAFASCVLPVVTGGLRWRKLPRETRYLLGIFSLYILVLTTQIIVAFNRFNTTWIGQIYNLGEYSVFAVVFSIWCDKERTKNLMIWSIPFFITVWIVAKLTLEPISKYDTYTGPIGTVMLIAMAIYSLIDLLAAPKESMYQKSRFWFSSGIIIYGVGTLPLFSLANLLLTRPLKEFEQMWAINWGLMIVVNCIYSRALLCNS